MIKLSPGDTVAIVSLSRGILGEPFAKHQLELGRKRLESFGLNVEWMPHALKGEAYLQAHPEKRAEDLLIAFEDSTIKGIICAIGGDDTYRLTPYLLTPDHQGIIRNNPKFFMGYSDTTINHLLLYQLGIHSFYGLSFLTDFAELDANMLEYSSKAFRHIFTEEPFVYTPSPEWYEERSDFSKSQINIPRQRHRETRGFELLQGPTQFSGVLLGGCIESMYDLIVGYRHPDKVKVNQQYRLFPSEDVWEDTIMFLETSEEKPSPEFLRQMLEEFKRRNIFDRVNGIIVGKPQDEVYYDAYRTIYQEVIPEHISVVYNLNFGHAYPKMLLQYGARAIIDVQRQRLEIERK